MQKMQMAIGSSRTNLIFYDVKAVKIYTVNDYTFNELLCFQLMHIFTACDVKAI